MIEGLDHYTIRCKDMERTRAFYCDVLGLRAGPRPEIGIAGYWLYCGSTPQVHLVGWADAEALSGSKIERGSSTGSVDHIAFRLKDPDALIAALKAHDIPFKELELREAGLRNITLTDPEGILVELNFIAPGFRRPV